MCLFVYTLIITKEEVTMDMRKLCDMLTTKEDIKDIPLMYIFRVTFAIFELINSGEYFLDSKEKEIWNG